MGEQMIVLLAAAIVIAAVLVAVTLRATGTPEPIRLRVPASPENVMQRIAMTAGALKKHSCSALGPSTMQVTRRRTPAWAVCVAVLLFPIGLLALAAKKEDTVVFTVTGTETGTSHLQSSGQMSPKLREQLLAVYGALPIA
jgi:hypothetical protein